MFVRPLDHLLAIPLIIITLGVALFFEGLFGVLPRQRAGSWSDFHLKEGFWTAVGGTLVIWSVNLLLSMAFGGPRGDRRAPRARQVLRAN